MRRVIMTGFDYNNEKAGNNLSWRAIFAGLVTFLALSILFMFIGSAIGFGVLDLTSSNPFSGVGTGLIVWTVIGFVLSTAAAGFVAGLTANRAGFIHGFLTWAINTIAVFALILASVSGLFSAAGSVASTAGSVVGDVAQTAGQAVGNVTQSAFDAISNNVNVDTEELNATVESTLRDTDIPELQPEYIQSQIDATVDDISTAAYNVLVGGNDLQSEIDKVTTNAEARINNIAEEVDRDAVTNAVAANTELSQEEADQAVDNIITQYNETAEQARTAIQNASDEVSRLADQASTQIDQTVQDVRVTGEEVTNSISNYSIWIFIGLVLGAIISGFAGYGGALTAIRSDNEAV